MSKFSDRKAPLKQPVAAGPETPAPSRVPKKQGPQLPRQSPPVRFDLNLSLGKFPPRPPLPLDTLVHNYINDLLTLVAKALGRFVDGSVKKLERNKKIKVLPPPPQQQKKIKPKTERGVLKFLTAWRLILEKAAEESEAKKKNPKVE